MDERSRNIMGKLTLSSLLVVSTIIIAYWTAFGNSENRTPVRPIVIKNHGLFHSLFTISHVHSPYDCDFKDMPVLEIKNDVIHRRNVQNRATVKKMPIINWSVVHKSKSISHNLALTLARAGTTTYLSCKVHNNDDRFSYVNIKYARVEVLSKK